MAEILFKGIEPEDFRKQVAAEVAAQVPRCWANAKSPGWLTVTGWRAFGHRHRNARQSCYRRSHPVGADWPTPVV